jgi:uncharacterized Zn finger protein
MDLKEVIGYLKSADTEATWKVVSPEVKDIAATKKRLIKKIK